MNIIQNAQIIIEPDMSNICVVCAGFEAAQRGELSAMDDLTNALHAFRNSLHSRADQNTIDILQRHAAALAKSGLAERAIGQGDAAPGFTLPDQNGRQVALSAELAKGPVVLVFVRGGWCPFCAITLRAYDAILPGLVRAGASLVAISPETPANVRVTAERHSLRFPLLSDAGLAVATAYGLVWSMDAELRGVYQKFGHDVPRINGTGDWRLPIPAGYVIGKDGKVQVARCDSNIVNRLPPDVALVTAQQLAVQMN